MPSVPMTTLALPFTVDQWNTHCSRLSICIYMIFLKGIDNTYGYSLEFSIVILWLVFRGQVWDFGLVFGSNHHRFLFDSEVNRWNTLGKLWAKGGYQCQSFGIDCVALIFSFLLVPLWIETHSFENLTTHCGDSRSSCWLSLRILNLFAVDPWSQSCWFDVVRMFNICKHNNYCLLEA